MSEQWPDIEGALRTWIRAEPTITSIVSTRVFFATPPDASEATYPLIKLFRVGGGDSGSSDAPIDEAQIQFDCEAKLRDKATALALKNALRSLLFSVRSPTAITANVVLFGAGVTTDLYLPDPADGRPRYVLTATVTSRAN